MIPTKKPDLVCPRCKNRVIGTAYVCPACNTVFCIRDAISLSERRETCPDCGSLLIFG
nr:hypothetical protein [Candidatus Sigynarchaeota archaeon]